MPKLFVAVYQTSEVLKESWIGVARTCQNDDTILRLREITKREGEYREQIKGCTNAIKFLFI